MATKKRGRKATEEMIALLRRCGDSRPETAYAAQRELVVALSNPLKQGVLDGDTVKSNGIFEPINFLPGQEIQFPTDFLVPGTEGQYTAFVIPNQGYIPERTVGGSYISVSTYDTGAALDWNLKYYRDARWDIVRRAMEILESMFVRKMNMDAWHVILAAGGARNIVTSDDAAAEGLLTKRLVALMETVMQRNAGGNSASVNRGMLTDLFMSPESHQDVLSWDLTQIPEAVRNSIYNNWQNGGVARIGRVNLHNLDELGVGQEYQTYWTSDLAESMGANKAEIVVGLDLQTRDSFVMPVREELQLFEDAGPGSNLHRQRRAGMYGWMEAGFACLDDRRVLIGEL